MLTFLRKIRKSFLDNGKTKNYFFYAIGEILLVMVGILLALQVNNWNQNRKDRILEQDYYCRLLEDAKLDIDQLVDLKTAARKRLSASNQAARLLQKNKAMKAEVGMQMFYAMVGSQDEFVPNNSAFEDLKSGGNMNIIKDKQIISSINKYFNIVNGYTDISRSNSTEITKINFGRQDRFSSGWVHSRMKTDRFLKGMEPDVFDEIDLSMDIYLPDDIKYQLYNDALFYISVNARRIEIYDLIEIEINKLKKKLGVKCNS